MTSISRNVLLYGEDADLPRPVLLRAGPWSLLFEAGDLRYIRLGEHEIIRRVYVAVRDHNWGTIPIRISDLKINSGTDHFTITYSADHRQREIDFHWDATIQGTAEGRISFSMQGEARSTFRRNRIGFCVLHPPQCAGQPCRIVQEFGEVIEQSFPRFIAPAPKEDPFQEIREMSYLVTEGVWAELLFEGDVFETEDQRNWIDGSYKTFCTPLRLPYPLEIRTGTQVSQRVELRLRDERSIGSAPRAESRTRLQIGQQVRPLPILGLCLTRHRHTERQIDRIKALNLSHLRTEVHAGGATARSDYLFAIEQSAKVGLPLEIAVYLSTNVQGDLERLTEFVKPEHAILRWLIFQASAKTTPSDVFAAARRALGPRTPQAQFGGGSAAYFTELNRERPDLSGADLLCYSINPQVHAFDNTSLIENALAIGYTVESARQLSGGRPVAISPVTLRPRFNPDATAAAGEPSASELPPAVDPRQMSLFGAVWTLASLKTIAESGADSATFYETVGSLGVMERDEGSPDAARFRSIAGGVFPLYHVFGAVGAFRGGEVVGCDCTRPLNVTGLALRKKGRLRIMLANLTAEPKSLVLEGADDGDYRETRLDESNVVAAMEQPEYFATQSGARRNVKAGEFVIELAPYGLMWLDGL